VKFKLKFVLLPLIIMFSVLILVQPITCFQVSGILIEGTYAPGDHITHQLIVESGKNEAPIDIQVDIMDAKQSLDGIANAIETNSDAKAYSAKDFFKASPTHFHLNPGDNQTVQVDGSIPSNASPGGKYAIISVHSLPQNNTGGASGASIVTAINTLVRLTITGGTLDKAGEIENLEVESPIADQQNLSLSYKNTGNIHYPVKVNAVLMNESEAILATASISSGSNIFPTATRTFELYLKPMKKLSPGKYEINATVTLEDNTTLATKEVQFQLKD
jgi:hypothetical protein